MTTEPDSEKAKAGDELDAPSMTRAAKHLLSQAHDVARRLGRATKQSVIDELLSRHMQLVADAMVLNNRAISLIAGEAKLEGKAIADKIAKVDATLKTIASHKRTLAILDALLGFVAAVQTGSGTAIVTAGITLDKTLETLGRA